MLGKLIKHELKSTAHSMFGVYLAAGITFLVMIVVLFLKSWLLKVISCLAMVGVMIAVLIITYFSIISLFHKSLYGAQGYLSFTLPVTGKQLLAAKTIVAVVWTSVSYLFTIVMGTYVVLYIESISSENIKEGLRAAYNLLQAFQSLPDLEFVVKMLILSGVFWFLYSISIFFRVSFSLTIANTKRFQKFNPILVAILIWAILFIIMIVSILACVMIPFGIAADGTNFRLVAGDAYNEIFHNSAVVPFPILVFAPMIVMSAILYVATGNMMNNRVNIK